MPLDKHEEIEVPLVGCGKNALVFELEALRPGEKVEFRSGIVSAEVHSTL